jgi:hypothetical protein
VLPAFNLRSRGEAGAAATTKTRDAWGSIFTNQINHAIPDRRAPHVVRETKFEANWISRVWICLM